MRHVTAGLLVGLLTLAGAARATGQTPRPTPPPTGGTRPSGGFTPFRDRGFGGTEFQSAALEQEDCPLQVSVRNAARQTSGVVLSLRLSNTADAATPWQVLGIWVIAPDGTVRGYQRFEARRPIAPGAARSLDVTLRQATTTVMPGDVVIVAVQEAAGTRAWRREARAIEDDARAVVLR